ncbi:hypothetical protein [Algibacter sp. 2305UL17-15]|uniref:hypothetical protein n=1 Tax=Algibacter sp. 2305UL17-15 TaxID=3231268 RepID=UPI003459A4E6
MKWNFNELRPGDEKQGIRDGDMSDFSKTHYKSVVRESIQNSLDARSDYSKPVIVDFSFKTYQKGFLENFATIEEHIKECFEYANNDDDLEFLSTMIESFQNKTEYESMEISDYNTLGMEIDSSYDSFANSRNISSKNSKGSAGSKGMGKAVYFASSYLHSILVSTKSVQNDFIFQGISKIATHKLDGVEYSHKGFFGNGMEATQNELDIPKKFQRSETGTSIYIIGLKPDEDRTEEMTKELLANFWLAIYEDDLIVKIDGKEFNSNTIYEEIKLRYAELDESGQYNKFPNPRPYFETFEGIQNTQKEYTDSIDVLGQVRLILARNVNYPGRIAFYRKSKMLIYKDSSYIYKGYCGLFICDDEEGNEILKKLENAKHNEWNSGNWDNPKANQAIRSYRSFVQKCVSDFTEVEQGLDISIPELDRLLGIMETGKTNGGAALDNGKVKTKEKPKPIKQKTIPSDRIPKNFNWLRCKVEPIQNSFEYMVSINSKVKDNNVSFEVLVGSDDKKGKNKVDLLSISDGTFEKNIITLNLKKGLNELSLILKDNLKHTIRLKEYNN